MKISLNKISPLRLPLPVRGWTAKALAVGLFSVLTLSSCVTDSMGDCPEGGEQVKKDSYFLTLNVSPTDAGTTRSETVDDGSSSDKTVKGSKLETTIVSANLYFCVDDQIIASFESDYIEPSKDKDDNFSIRFVINDDINQLEALVDKEDAELFIVANTKIGENATDILYTPDFGADGKDMMSATFNMGSDVTQYPIGDYGNDGHYMPLVNAEQMALKITKLSDEETAFEAIKRQFNINTGNINWWYVNDGESLKLERAVARLEYRGKIREDLKQVEETEDSHVYPVGNTGMNIKLYSLIPFNVNKQSYLFKHTLEGTHTDATASGNDIQLFGKENGGKDNAYNWISSPWWTPGYTQEFLNPLTMNSDQSAYEVKGEGEILLTDLVKRTPSESNIQKVSGIWVGGFHPWCYVSENTLYNTEMMDDEVRGADGKSKMPAVAEKATGAAFKFMILDNQETGKPLTPGTESANLPGGITMDEDGKITITDMSTGDWIEVEPTELTEGNETHNYYFLTYIACIKHNVSATTNAMRYGVVRNNSYQMSVSSINNLPLPKEPRTLFLELQINVLNWNKRDVQYEF